MIPAGEWKEFSRKAIMQLEESGDLDPLMEKYLIYGNPVNPRYVLVFEKESIFRLAVKEIDLNPEIALMLCSKGIPSERFLRDLKRLENKKIFYFGDLDPHSLYAYLALKYLRLKPDPRNVPKAHAKFCGITSCDHEKYGLSEVAILLSSGEKDILEFVEVFEAPELKKEINLLRAGYKFEIEGLSHQFKYYNAGAGDEKKATTKEVWLEEFKRYFFEKLAEVGK
ncbi:MAG: hypothetical protein ACP5E4_01915 [Candidatus Aenigmatarchaeota archaeon]